MADPCRGEVWSVDLGTGKGHEQAGSRPALILSVDVFNAGPAGLVFAVPITSKAAKSRNIPAHVPVNPPEGGLKTASVLLCDALRSVSRDRLGKRWGIVATDTLAKVEDAVRLLLGL